MSPAVLVLAAVGAGLVVANHHSKKPPTVIPFRPPHEPPPFGGLSAYVAANAGLPARPCGCGH